MGNAKPFRFGVQSRTAGPRDVWLGTVRTVEALGYDAISWPDHFVRGFEPAVALAAAAIASERLRLTGFVFDNDFRHPVVLAMSAGSIDILSAGRLELGIGAGWLKDEYDQSGIPFDPASVRIARLEEAVHLLKRLFSGEPVTFSGEFYAVDGLKLPVVPVQRPHPPFIIGGGSKKILSLAAREADIVGITNRALPDGSKDAEDTTAAATERKIAWVREAAGERFPEIELNAVVSDVVPTIDTAGEAARLADRYGVSPTEILDSPLILVGSIDEMVERLLERRERFGISYLVVTEPNMDALAPVVARLAGR